MSRPEPTPVSASSRLKRRALASLCALSFATGTVVVPSITPTANAVAATEHKNQYAETPANGYAKYTKLDANGRRNNPCNVSTAMVHEYSSIANVIHDTVNGVGRFMAVKTDNGSNFELQVVAQMGNDQGNGDMFPRYREKASFSFNSLNTAPLKPIGAGETVKFESRPEDDLIVTDAGDDIDSQKKIPLDGNQNTVMAWRFDNTSLHLTEWALANNIDPGSLTLGDVFGSVPMAMSATLAPFPDENAFCQVMNTKSTPVTMLADGEAHPFEIGLVDVKPEDYERLEVVVVDKDGKKIEGATVAKGAVVNDQYGLPIAMKTQVTLPKDNPDYHNGKGVFLQVYATPRDGDSDRAKAGPNKGTGLSGNYAYSREDAKGKGLYDTNMKIGGLHAINTPTFRAEHGANSGEPGETISAQIVGADQPDKGVKSGQPFLGENNPTFSLGGNIEYGKKNQGDNKWTNPQVDPVTGEATITVSEGAQGGDLAYVPVKVTNSDGSSFIIKATFTSKQPAPVALQPAFKAGPVGDTLKATPRYKRNGEPYIDPETVRIVGTDEKSDGKTLEVDGQGMWRVDAKTGEFSFTPVAGFVGDPTSIQYTAKGAKGEEPIQPAEVMFTYYPLETREATTYGPVEATQKSTDNNSPGDAGRTTAELFPGLPSTWYGQADSPVTFQLVGPAGKAVAPGTALKIENVGEYTIDPVTGVVSFKADPNLLGDAPEKDGATVGIRTVGLTNAERDGEDAQLTAYYRPTVEKQSFALPNARENAPVTGDAWTATPNYRAFSVDPKTVTMVPVEGNELSEDGKKMKVPGQGTWTVDNNGVFTFTPVETFVGTPAPVRYEANSTSGQKAEGTGQVAIFYPEARTMPSNTIGGQGIEQKSDEVASVTGEEQDFGVTTAEMFPTLPTKWYGQQDSKVTFDLIGPDGKVVESTVKGEDGIARPTVEVPNVGTYSLNPITGLATFDPLPSFTGPAPRVHIQTKGLTGGNQLKASYTPFVTPLGTEIPSAFVNAKKIGDTVKVTPDYSQGQTEIDKTSIQLRTDNLPEGSTLSDDKKSVTVPGEGTWNVNEEGEFTFTPQAPGKNADGTVIPGFTGNPTPVSYLAKNTKGVDAYVPGQVAAFYPPIQTADSITTDDRGVTQLSTDIQDGVEDKGLTLQQMFPNVNPDWVKAGLELTAPQGGTLSDDKSKLTVDGQGVYTLDKTTGVITFKPEPKFEGTASKVGITITGIQGAPTAYYTPIVRPGSLTLPSQAKEGKLGDPIELKPDYADTIDKRTLQLLDDQGNPTDSLTQKDVGTWTVDKQKGTFLFTPVEGYLGGIPEPVKYTAKNKRGDAAKPGTLTVSYPKAATKSDATADMLGKPQTSELTLQQMFPDLPSTWDVTYTLDGAGEDGKVVVKGEGTYEIVGENVKFTPEPQYTGRANGVKVTATTKLGTTLDATYQPTVLGTSNDFTLPTKAVEEKLGNAAKITPDYPKNIDYSTIKILNGDQLIDTLEVTENGKKVGEWTVDKRTGEFTFKPEEGYLGTPGPVQYTAKNTAGQDAVAPGSVVATYPKPRTADSATADQIDVNQTSRKFTGDNGMFPDLPAAWDVKYTLKGAETNGPKQGRVVRPGVGEYYIENGAVVFDPEPGYVGKDEPVTVVAKTATGETLEAKYEPVVIGVKPPTTTTPTTSTQPTDPSSPESPAPSSPNRPVDRPFVLPSGAKMGALGKPVDVTPKYPDWVAVDSIRIKGSNGDGKTLKVDGQGTWTVDKNGRFTFTPEPGFLGTPEPITYTAKDKDGKDSDAPGWVMAYYPADADADADADANPFILPSDAVNIPKGGQRVFDLLEMNNQIDPATIAIAGAVDGKLVVPGEGTWSVNNDTGEVTFTAEKDFEGTATPVKYTARSKSGVESRYPAFLMVATDGKDPVPGPVNPSNPPAPGTPDGSSGEAKAVIERCFANAVRSPIAWVLPIGLLAVVGGKLAEPFIGQYQAQLNGLNAEIQGRFNEATKDWNRDWGWGHGGHGGDRNNERYNEAFGELAARVNAANAQLQQLANDPMIRQVGQVAGVILAMVAASAVLYDWCAPGKGYTAIDFEGTGERGSSNRDKKPEQSNPTKVDTKAEGSKKNEGGSSDK